MCDCSIRIFCFLSTILSDCSIRVFANFMSQYMLITGYLISDINLNLKNVQWNLFEHHKVNYSNRTISIEHTAKSNYTQYIYLSVADGAPLSIGPSSSSD